MTMIMHFLMLFSCSMEDRLELKGTQSSSFRRYRRISFYIFILILAIGKGVV